MKIQKVWKSISIASAIAVLLVGYTNCSQPKVTENVSQESLSSAMPKSLSLSPTEKSINWNGRVQFNGSGGVAPYYYTVVSGSGSIDYTTGLYTAPGFDRATVIQVKDSTGALAMTNVYSLFSASSTLSLGFSQTSIHPGDTVTLTASGGTAPYTYSMVSGVGSVASNVYYASSFGSGVIAVRDAAGVQGTFGVTVEASMVITSHQIYSHYHPSVKIFRFDKSATPASGFTLVGAVFKLLTPSTYMNTVALRRCYISGDKGSYLTTSAACVGNYIDEGILGYVFQYAAPNTKPLYNCFNSTSGKYFFATSGQVCLDNGFSVLPAALGHVPL